MIKVGDNMELKLYKVTALFNPIRLDTFESLVIAGNEIEAQRIVEEEVWTLGGMEIENIEQINMEFPQILCCINTKNI